MGRLQSRDRLEAESNDFHERVRQEYLQIAMMDPERYFVVDGTQSVEEINAQITARVAELPMLKRNLQGPQVKKLLHPIRTATTAVSLATHSTGLKKRNSSNKDKSQGRREK